VNTLGENIGNLMGTHWELERNMLGIKEKRKRSSPTPSPPKLERKKSKHFE
jgi:hypothetical protein